MLVTIHNSFSIFISYTHYSLHHTVDWATNVLISDASMLSANCSSVSKADGCVCRHRIIDGFHNLYV
jgi:hypothetical protein